MKGRYMGAQIFAGATMAVSGAFLETARRADVTQDDDMEK
jgi:hypothetical protein